MKHDPDSTLFESAMRFALDAHAGMTRKASATPYILHPMEVATIAASMTDDPEVLAAAVLHDVVEDTPCSLDEIECRFGSRVAQLVASETENKYIGLPKSETWRRRKEESLANLKDGGRDVKILWLSDKLSNIRSFHRLFLKEGSSLWNSFNQNNPAQQAWYYSTILRYCAELSEENAWREFDYLVRIVFEKELS